MIAAVIADDLTGAAELASAAVELGFSAEVHTKFDPSSDAEIICVDTDSRSLSSHKAADVVARVTREVFHAKPSWIFKKTDSVLRGNVRAEVESILEVAGLSNALLVPANPSKSRVIRGGIYFVNGIPLSQTAFANDPDHPCGSSDVSHLLGGQRQHDLITCPDATDEQTIAHHANTIDLQTLAAGGVDFFKAVLMVRAGVRSIHQSGVTLNAPTLFCCGSLQAWCAGRAGQCSDHGIPIEMVSEEWMSGQTHFDVPTRDWAMRVSNALLAHGRVMVAIGTPRPGQPSTITTQFAQVVAQIVTHSDLSTLCIEGGATAAAVLKQLSFSRMNARPSPELSGVAALQPFGRTRPLILMKPGSYPWPDKLWRMFDH